MAVGKLGEVFQFLDSIGFGETVLVEYTSPNYTLDFMVLLLKRYADDRGHPFVVDDNLDTLHVINEHLKFFGVRNIFDDAIVLKTGGIVNIGNVVGRVKVESEASIYLRRYEEASTKAFSGLRESINVVIGLEKLFAFVEDYRNFYEIISSIDRFLGNRKRKAFYLLDRNICERIPINPLPELEKIASTFLDVRLDGNRLIGRIRKSPDIRMMGWEIEVSVEDIL
ncbi:DUF257 family protein [Thermococcus sp. 5-4]|uniref:DUF257 family protein n=1 Tax=Thermococcus sp. 5-4 TaxID=2008440 RepID=UPI000B49B20C|nr:DUF257 family protein [Thermococcus sp. 5-4]ASA77009.1 hypothetical protein CDI07_01425 [Thermococcus sp. 5-4]